MSDQIENLEKERDQWKRVATDNGKLLAQDNWIQRAQAAETELADLRAKLQAARRRGREKPNVTPRLLGQLLETRNADLKRAEQERDKWKAARDGCERQYQERVAELYTATDRYLKAEALLARYREALEEIVKIGEAEVYAGSCATPIVATPEPPNGHAMLALARQALEEGE